MRVRTVISEAFFGGLLLCLSPAFVGPAAAQTWSQASSGGTRPTQRYSGGTAYDDTNDRLIIFSGEDAGGLPRPQDVWVLTDATGVGGTPAWVQLAPVGGPPFGRFGQTVLYAPDSNRIIIHGGCNANCGSALADTWVLTNANGLGGTQQWIQHPAFLPVNRAEHAAAYDPGSNRMMVFGGHQAFPGTDLDDVWVLTNADGLGGTPQWIQLAPTGTSPTARQASEVAYDAVNNRLIIFGGRSAVPISYNDVWVLTNANGLGGVPQWLQLVPTGALPVGRSAHVLKYDHSANRVILFGGVVAGGAAPHTFLNDVWALSNADGLGGTPQWMQLSPSGTLPAGRAYVSAGYSASSNRLVVALGRNDDVAPFLFNDHWVLADAKCPGSNDHLDSDGDGRPDACDVCPLDAGNDADSDGVCASSGDCNDLNALISPHALERCDNVDQDCDGDLELVDACVAECDNGTVNGMPLTAPACPNPNNTTQISDVTQLNAWRANPVTSADIKSSLALAGSSLTIVTNCDLKVRSNVALTGIANLFVAARNVDIGGDIQTSGQALMRGTSTLILRQSSTSTFHGLTFESPVIDLHGDHNFGGFCAEGGQIISRQSSAYHLTGARAVLTGSTLDIHGDYDNCSSFTAKSTGDFLHRQSSRIMNCGAVTLAVVGSADIHGETTGATSVTVDANALIYRQTARIQAVGPVSVVTRGTGVLDWHGTVDGSVDVTVDSAGDLLLRQTGTITSNRDIALHVAHYFEGRGKVRFNRNVSMNTGTYWLANTNDFRFNTTCSLTGTKQSGSNAALGCIEGP